MRLELRWRRERKTKSWRRSGGGRNVMTHTNVFGDGWCKSWPILFFIWKLNKKLPSFFPKWEKFIPDEKRNFFKAKRGDSVKTQPDRKIMWSWVRDGEKRPWVFVLRGGVVLH
jgi:hypothetical protein